MMYVIHSSIAILFWVFIIVSFSGCSTTESTHPHCEYEQVPDASGSAKWEVVCTTVERPVDNCSCQYTDERDHEGELFDIHQAEEIISESSN